MKPLRIFLAVQLPDTVKQKLLAFKEQWPELPARWTSPHNLHFTLVFLGNTSEAELQTLVGLCKEVGERHAPFKLAVEHIMYGPHSTDSGQATPRTRMVWAQLTQPRELTELQKDIGQSLTTSKEIFYKPEKRGFTPHLTLARLRQWEAQRMELEELPQIDEEISLFFSVNSFDIMQSQLRRTGAEYTTLQSIPLHK